MAQTTTRTPQRQQQAQPPTSAGQVAVIAPPRLLPPPDTALQSYDVDNQGWRTLVESIFPAAKTATSVMMALDYCKRRKLDVFKHPVHIVPIWNSQANDGKGAMVETIWPGINELRTTAIRTGQYAGMDMPVFGPLVERHFKGKIKKWANGGAQWEDVKADVQFPEWCQITVYRTLGGNRVPFPGPRVYWVETYSRIRNDCEVPNSMWEKRANGQLEKCAEAAALRRAFPEELGSDYSIDEIGAFTTHSPTDITDEASATTTAPPEPKRDDPKYQQTPPAEATPHSEPRAVGQPGEKAAEAPTATPGQPAEPEKPAPETATNKADLVEDPKVTDVEDLNEKPKLEFQEYKRVGDFFVFSDAWLQDPKRTADEAKQWEAFYRDYIKEKANSKNDAIKAAVADTLGIYSGVLAKEMQREPGQEG